MEHGTERLLHAIERARRDTLQVDITILSSNFPATVGESAHRLNKPALSVPKALFAACRCGWPRPIWNRFGC